MSRASYPLAFPRLKARIAELDRSQVEIAAEVPCARETLTQILRGRLRPSARMRSRLAEILDAPEDDLFTRAGEEDAA